MIRPEVEAFIVLCRRHGMEWSELEGGKAERLYDHIEKRLGVNPLWVAESTEENLHLWGVAAEVCHKYGYNAE